MHASGVLGEIQRGEYRLLPSRERVSVRESVCMPYWWITRKLVVGESAVCSATL